MAMQNTVLKVTRYTKAPLIIAALACLAAGLAACDRNSATAPVAPPSVPATIQESMQQSLTPQSSTLWEISGRLYDPEGNIDATLLTTADWRALQLAASGMRDAAAALQTTSLLRVVAPGAQIQGEGGAGALDAAQIQALVDAQPEAFAAEAGKLVELADRFLAAIAARDGETIDALSAELNEACAACHARFWYPQPPAE